MYESVLLISCLSSSTARFLDEETEAHREIRELSKGGPAGNRGDGDANPVVSFQIHAMKHNLSMDVVDSKEHMMDMGPWNPRSFCD